MLENQAKTLSFKTNEEVSNSFDKLEARIKEIDPTLTRGDVLATVIQAAEKTIITEDNIKLATREELRLIDQHTQRLKDIYLSIFKRSEDHQLMATNKVKTLETTIAELKDTLKNDKENYKFEIDLIHTENNNLKKENEEIIEKSRVIENSFLDKERTIKNLEDKISELEEIRIENRSLSRENKDLLAQNNEISNKNLNLEHELKHREFINETLEKEKEASNLEIKELNSRIQEIISEKEKEKALEIKDVNIEHKKELDALNLQHRNEIDKIRDEYNLKIQELNRLNVALETELNMVKLIKE